MAPVGVPSRQSSARGLSKSAKCMYPTGQGLDLWHQCRGQTFMNPACSALSLGPDQKCGCRNVTFLCSLMADGGVPARPNSARGFRKTSKCMYLTGHVGYLWQLFSQPWLAQHPLLFHLTSLTKCP
jgi:hypothetical protein